jgi:hypothetical protein
MDPRGEDLREETDNQQRDEPEVVPAISSEQPPVAAGVGVGAYVGRDNDQESHVPPADNDGETVPHDEVADQAGA